MRPTGPRLRSIHSRTTGSATFQMSSFGSKLRATPSTTTMVFCSRISSGRVRMSNRPVTSSSSVNSFAIEISSAVRMWIGSARGGVGAATHVEQAGDADQQRQQLRHRNLCGGAVVDRLADGADGLGKILHRMMPGHIAGLEMHLGDAAIVAGDEAQQNFGEEAPLLHAEPAHDAEIHGDKPAGVVEEQIAGMHVGMKEAVAQRMAQEALDHLAAESRS